jgi:hypothetical protein
MLIIFRKELKVNIFRDLIIATLSSKLGDEAVIGSGFFQEEYRTQNSYRLSREYNFLNAMKGVTVTTVGVYSSMWRNSYLKFVEVMRNNGIKTDARYVSGNKWHAKIYLLLKNKTPEFGIIGSSNMTRSAFGIQGSFNYECDVALWDNSAFTTLVEETTKKIEDKQSFINAEYDAERNGGLSVSQRLAHLRDEVFKLDKLKTVN